MGLIKTYHCICFVLFVLFRNHVLATAAAAAPGKSMQDFVGSSKQIIHRKNNNQDGGPIYFRCIQNGTIALTFDDGPTPGRTDQLVDLLRDRNVKATFFVVGNVSYNSGGKPAGLLSTDDQYSQITLRRTVANGHVIGHHTWTHPSSGLAGLSEGEILHEMNTLTEAIIRIIGIPPTIMRPPFGSYDDQVVRIVHELLGFKIIMLSIDTNDLSHPGDTDAGLAEYVKVLNGTDPSLTPGFIAIHHDFIIGAAELAGATIDYARSVGYRYVSLDECLGLQ